MSVAVYPLDAVDGSPAYSGRILRDTLAAVLGGATSTRPLGAFSGVRPGTPENTVTLSGTTWTLTPFAGVLDVQAAAEAGPYLFAVTGSEIGALDAASASNPRKDILSIQLSDPAESDGTSVPKGEVVYTAGTPAAVPSAPATPDRSLKLAEFTVPKSGTGDPTVAWVAPVLFAAGGIAQVATVAALGGLPTYDGARADVLATPGATWRYSSTAAEWIMHGVPVFASTGERDSALPAVAERRCRVGNTIYRANGSVFKLEQRPKTSYTPTFASGFTLGNGTLTAWYQVINERVFFHIEIVAGSTTSWSGGNISPSIPFGTIAGVTTDATQDIGSAAFLDASAANRYSGRIHNLDSNSRVQPRGTGGNTTATTAWSGSSNIPAGAGIGTGDTIVFDGSYLPA